MAGFRELASNNLRQGDNSGVPVETYQPSQGSRIGSRERLDQLRENDRQYAQLQRGSNEIDRQRMESPLYQVQRDNLEFPKIGFLDSIKGKQIELLEEHIVDTEALRLTPRNDKEIFEQLYERTSVIKLWIKKHKTAFKALDPFVVSNTSAEQNYQEKVGILKKARLKVSGLIISDQHGGHLNTVDLSWNIKKAIDEYKVALKDVLFIARNLYRVTKGETVLPPEYQPVLPLAQPLQANQSDERSQTMTPEEIERGAKGIQRMREEAEQRKAQEEQKEQNRLDEQRRQEEQIRNTLKRTNNTNQ